MLPRKPRTPLRNGKASVTVETDAKPSRPSCPCDYLGPETYCDACRERWEEGERERRDKEAAERRQRRARNREMQRSTCAVCGDLFQPTREDQRFCKDACRPARLPPATQGGVMSLPPHVRAEAQRTLDGAARRLLDERHGEAVSTSTGRHPHRFDRGLDERTALVQREQLPVARGVHGDGEVGGS